MLQGIPTMVEIQSQPLQEPGCIVHSDASIEFATRLRPSAADASASAANSAAVEVAADSDLVEVVGSVAVKAAVPSSTQFAVGEGDDFSWQPCGGEHELVSLAKELDAPSEMKTES